MRPISQEHDHASTCGEVIQRRGATCRTCPSQQPSQLRNFRVCVGDDLGRTTLSRLASGSGRFEAARHLWYGCDTAQNLGFAWGDDLGRRALSRLSFFSGLYEAARRLWYGIQPRVQTDCSIKLSISQLDAVVWTNAHPKTTQSLLKTRTDQPKPATTKPKPISIQCAQSRQSTTMQALAVR